MTKLSFKVTCLTRCVFLFFFVLRACNSMASRGLNRTRAAGCASPLQVEEMILDKDDKKAFAVLGGKITEDQLEYVEEKPKKKAGPPPVAPQ